MKGKAKVILCLAAIITCFAIVGTIDYQDAKRLEGLKCHQQ